MPDPYIYNEKELFTLIAAGDEAAFTACVHRFTPALFSYIKRMVRAENWAEDLLQDLFIWVWNNRTKLPVMDNPGAYLHRMATHLSLNFIRRRSTDVVAHYGTQETGEQVAGPDADLYDRSYYARLLAEAVARLTPQQQRIYRLRYEEGLSYEEIAERLSISRNTVRNHLVAAMEDMRTYLRARTDLLAVTVVLIKNSLL